MSSMAAVAIALFASLLLISRSGSVVGELDLINLNLTELRAELFDRGNSCVNVTGLFLRRIRQYNRLINAIITVDERGALDSAVRLDEQQRLLDNGQLGPLHCVPLLVKDNIPVEGLPTTLGLRSLANSTAVADAPAIATLRRAGVVILGKANLSPLSASHPNYPSQTGGLVRNPYAINYTCYSSSNGNAAAQAARLTVLGIGSDSSGSITSPASATHVVGVRPPLDAFNMSGLFPLLGNTWDTMALMTFTVADARTMLSVLNSSHIRRPPRSGPIRVAILERLTFNDDAAVGMVVDLRVQTALRLFERQLSLLDGVNVSLSSYDIRSVITATASGAVLRYSCIDARFRNFVQDYPMTLADGRPISNLSDLLTVEERDQTSNETIGGLKLEEHVILLRYLINVSPTCNESSAALKREQLERTIRSELLNDFDVIACAQFPFVPFRTDGPAYRPSGAGPDLAASLGFPAVSVPNSFTEPEEDAPDGLPIGVYLFSAPEKFEMLLDVAQHYQESFVSPKMPRDFL